ncbi:TPA: hypothetical protein EYP26_06200 [Candidatus Bathyarchaeota archaeon]|nr:hypothetical protein [Candidatus Bathyarchaeota archaeon]
MPEDLTLEIIRRKKLMELQKRLAAKKLQKEVEGKSALNVDALLNKVFIGRAWEVFRAAQAQYPNLTRKIGEWLARLINEGGLKGPITGEQLLWFFRKLGLNVRLETRIRILESGELKSLAEKLKGR